MYLMHSFEPERGDQVETSQGEVVRILGTAAWRQEGHLVVNPKPELLKCLIRFGDLWRDNLKHKEGCFVPAINIHDTLKVVKVPPTLMKDLKIRL